MLFLPFSSSAEFRFDSKDLTFHWERGPGQTAPAGYIFYYGKTSSKENDFSGYDFESDVKAAQSHSVSISTDDADVYYFSVAAYDEHGLIGPYSQELTSQVHTVVSKAQPGGMISPMGEAISYRGGEKAVFNMEAFPGYEISDVLVDGISVGTPSSHSFFVEDDHEVEVFFAVKTYAVAARAVFAGSGGGSPGGLIEPQGVFQAEPLSSRTFTITPLPGYEVSHVLVNGEEVTLSAGGIYALAEISQDVLLEAFFVEIVASPESSAQSNAVPTPVVDPVMHLAVEPLAGANESQSASSSYSEVSILELTPAAESPLPGAVVAELKPRFALRLPLSTLEFVDGIEVQVSLDSEFTRLFAHGGMRPVDSEPFWSVPVELSNLNFYFWRARVLFGENVGPWTAAMSFLVDVEATAVQVNREAAIALLPGESALLEINASSGASGLVVEVASGAIRFERLLTVDSIDVFPYLPDGVELLGDVLALGPRGFDFKEQVGVELPVPESFPGGQNLNGSTLALFSYDSASMAWERIPTVLSEDGSSFSAKLSSFSIVALGAIEPRAARAFDQEVEAAILQAWENSGGADGAKCFISSVKGF